MTERRRKLVHGATLSAPLEAEGFAADAGAPVQRRARAASAPEAARAGWLPRLWSLAKLAVGVVLVIGASGAVAWGAHHYALTSQRFALRQVSVDGARRMSTDQVIKAAGLEIGENVFAIDLEATQQKLLADPWIREVKLTRELPGTLRLEIVEREAGAVLVLDEALYLVTRQGEPFKRLEDGDPYDLPLITGVAAAEFARDRPGAVERVQTALRVLRDYGRLPLSKAQVPQEVHVAGDGHVVLTIGKQGTALHLGEGPWGKKLAMAERVVEKARSKGQVPGIVFLDNEAHPERVVVRMR